MLKDYSQEKEFRRFENLDDFYDFIQTIKPYSDEGYGRECHGRDEWYGMPHKDAVAQLVKDYTKYRSDAEEIIEKMDADGIFSVGLPLPERSYYGQSIDLLGFLADRPKQMKRRIRSEKSAQCTPVNIYIDVGVSQGVTEETIAKRGIAVCALAMALRNFRPVNVYCVSALHSAVTTCHAIQVCDDTLDIGRILFCFSSQAFLRRLIFANHQDMDRTCAGWIGWGWNSAPTQKEYTEKLRKKFGITADDIYITGGYLEDSNFMRDPVMWVKDMVHKHKFLQENEE